MVLSVSSMQRSQEMYRVFLYGTLKRGEPNEFVLRNPSLGVVRFLAGGRTVRKFPLIIASEFNIPYLLFKPGHGNRIVGEIFEIENLSVLDEFEGYPGYYTRSEEDIELESGSITKAWLYTLENFKPELLEKPFLSNYCSKELNELAFKSEAHNTRQHEDQVKKFD